MKEIKCLITVFVFCSHRRETGSHFAFCKTESTMEHQFTSRPVSHLQSSLYLVSRTAKQMSRDISRDWEMGRQFTLCTLCHFWDVAEVRKRMGLCVRRIHAGVNQVVSLPGQSNKKAQA